MVITTGSGEQVAEIGEVVIAKKEDDIVGVLFLEGDDVTEAPQPRIGGQTFVVIGIHIIAEKDDFPFRTVRIVRLTFGEIGIYNINIWIHIVAEENDFLGLVVPDGLLPESASVYVGNDKMHNKMERLKSPYAASSRGARGRAFTLMALRR